MFSRNNDSFYFGTIESLYKYLDHSKMVECGQIVKIFVAEETDEEHLAVATDNDNYVNTQNYNQVTAFVK